MRDLPAHHQHQEKSEQQETQRGKTVLDADDFVVGRKNIPAPKIRLGMLVAVIVMFVVRVRRVFLAIRRKLVNG